MGRYQSNKTPETEDDAFVRDVIMGRGKRVSEWPGNVFFRQVVNKHRQVYAEAHRSKKVDVAIAVIAEVHKNRGRFMAEDHNGAWVEIEHARAVEKSCQALREKEKPNTMEGDPFSAAALRIIREPTLEKRKASPSTRIMQKKSATIKNASGKQNQVATASESSDNSNSTEDDDNDDHKSTRSTSASSSSASIDDDVSTADDSGSESDTESENIELQPLLVPKGPSKTSIASPAQQALMDSPVNRVLYSQEAEMLKKLDSFVELHGHCGIPPEWPADTLLADWCTVQRQLHRAIHQEYLTAPTSRQLRLMEKLEKLEFVWDYEDWHWEHKFNDFVASHEAATASQSDTMDAASVYWLDDQRRQYLENRASVRHKRAAKLLEAGIPLT
jgi:hypothetical protein